MDIDPLSPVPSYKQLAAALRAEIAAGRRTPRSPLPSIAELARDTALSEGTVRHALDLLKQEGAIVGVPGRGTFVA